jgi:hypothetical protein
VDLPPQRGGKTKAISRSKLLGRDGAVAVVPTRHPAAW